MGKAQIFYIDAIFGIAIFATAVVLFLSLTNSIMAPNTFDVIVTDSEAISSSLLTKGQPSTWTANNVTKIGLTDGSYRLQSQKVASMMNVSPNSASSLFGTSTDFAIFFKDKDNNVLNINGCIYSSANLTVQNLTQTLCENFTITPDNHLVHVERLVIYNGQIIKMITQVWT